MNYDFSISDDVSLSKILDVFLLDNEDPNVVIEFLKQHDDTLEEILNKSICVGKIFQYSFFKKLNLLLKLIAANNYYDNFLANCVIRFIEQLLEFEQDKISF